MKLYVASSWRNDRQPRIVRYLRAYGHEVYDFRNPPGGDTGFHWSDISENWECWKQKEFTEALNHPMAERGFKLDWEGMQWAEACVLVMPCGRSPHLEAGYFVGAGKPLLILLSDGEPELMYKMATGVYADLGLLQIALQDIEAERNGDHAN